MFQYFLIKSFLLATSYRVLVKDIKSLIVSPLDNLETRLKVPIFAIFWFLAGFFYVFNEKFVQRMYFHVSWEINDLFTADQIFVNCAIWPGP